VLDPIERMMNMVEAVANDPLEPLHFDHAGEEGPGEYETRLLETTIEKITGLLRVGFGEAGAGIISANLSIDAASGTGINPLLPGIRVYVIVGFCDIHHFEEVLVKLSDDVLTFVNTIAEIVHESVSHWGGQCNKNLGNAFVILWRINDEVKLQEILSQTSFRKPKAAAAGVEGEKETTKAKSNKTITDVDPLAGNADVAVGVGSKKKNNVIDLRRVPGIDVLADQSLIGYLKIIAELNRSKAVLAYRNEPRLTHNGTEEFTVRMGFGLHAGWAIEGAVGSIFKVDATYLSPHVNMAARLETSSRQYGVPLLISHFVHELFSEPVQKKCRKIDICTVKGSEVPISVFTYDCLQEQVFRSKPVVQVQLKKKANNGLTIQAGSTVQAIDGTSITYQSIVPLDVDDTPTVLPASESVASQTETDGGKPKTQYVEGTPGTFLTNTEDTVDVFEKDDDLLLLRAHVTSEFTETFNRGIEVYLAGDWPEARIFLEKANEIMAKLAPSSPLGGDGPCLTLLSYMRERDWKAPEDWAGYRPLTSK